MISKEEHKSMVLRLKKPGQDILSSLTPEDCDLLHMSICLPGEASELYDAVGDIASREELLEELGDFVFYYVALRVIFGMDVWTGYDAGYAEKVPPQKLLAEIMRESGHLVDPVKRIVIYRKPWDVPDKKFNGKTLKQVAQEHLHKVEGLITSLLRVYEIELQEVLDENWNKLADADKGRYASGTYTDQQAQDRRDKEHVGTAGVDPDTSGATWEGRPGAQ